RVPAVLLAAALVAAPVSMRTPVADDRQFAGQLPLIEGTCAGLSRAGADHVVWVDSYAFPYLATLRIVCDVQVVDFGREPTRTDLAQVAAAWHGERVVVLAGDPALLGLPGNAQPLVPRAASSFWAWHLSGPPASNWTYQMGMWGGTLNADGKVTPLPGSVLTAG
ncbi:MAG: hypothetical protein FWF28_08020, partial [Micrococcales bacterium]|nr:hypothetical protein [Micrococcales bacterium]